MKQFELKSTRKKAYAATVIFMLVLFLFVISFIFVGLMNKHGEAGIIVPLVVLGIILFALKRYFAATYRVDISDDRVSIYRSDRLQTWAGLNEIAMLRLKGNETGGELLIYRVGDARPMAGFESMRERDVNTMRAIVDEFKERLEMTEGIDGPFAEYINRNVVKNNADAITRIRGRKDPRRNVFKYVALGALFLFVVLPLLMVGLKERGEGLMIGSEDVTYNGESLGLNMDQFERVGYYIVKDSSKVFFEGKLLEWADAPSLRAVGSSVYIDRKGIYIVKNSLFSKNEIVPLKGDFDVETFTSVRDYGTDFFKDKNNVYYFDFNLMSGKSPIKRVKVEGIDAATFEAMPNASHLWYRDGNNVYFGNWNELRVCPEIDRETFEVLSATTSKDINNVYYLTRDLSSDGEKATERDDYAVLQGAHAPSFEMIDDKTYEDENTVWTISDGNEADVRERDDVDW